MADVLDSIKTLLSNDWNDTNTDSITPQFENIFDVKRIDFGILKRDWILVYNPSYTQRVNGLGDITKRVLNRISIDIRTMDKNGGRSHAMKVRDEVIRIIDAKVLYPFDDYSIGEIDSITDLSDKTIKLWRFLVDVRVEALNRAR